MQEFIGIIKVDGKYLPIDKSKDGPNEDVWVENMMKMGAPIKFTHDMSHIYKEQLPLDKSIGISTFGYWGWGSGCMILLSLDNIDYSFTCKANLRAVADEVNLVLSLGKTVYIKNRLEELVEDANILVEEHVDHVNAKPDDVPTLERHGYLENRLDKAREKLTLFSI